MTEYSNQGQGTAEYQMKGEGEAVEQPFAGLGNGQTVTQSTYKYKQVAKRLAIPGGIILSVLILYLFLSWTSSGTKDKTATQQVITPKKEMTIAPPEQAFTPTVPAQSAVSQDQIANLVSGQVAQSQSAIQSKLDDMASQVASTRDQVATLSTNMDQNKQDIAAINQNISNIVTSLQGVVTTLQKITAPKKTKRIARRYRGFQLYHIKAIVPGRAWLESSCGKLVTVRVGDRLEGYGRIRLISPRQGLVITSAGTQIQYGVNDI